MNGVNIVLWVIWRFRSRLDHSNSIKNEQNISKKLEINEEKLLCKSYRGTKKIFFEIMEQNTFPLLDFGLAPPLNASAYQRTMGTIEKLVKNYDLN